VIRDNADQNEDTHRRISRRILLDEVNLASHETLQSLTAMLESATSSITLTERGDLEPVRRHPDFRLFACMNPATDVGKKDLLPGLRARFTEIFVPPPDDDKDALLAIVKQYLGNAVAGDRSAILDVAEFYLSIKAMSRAKELVDGSNFAPHYSMRTLARALTFAVEVAPMFGNLRRALWEGCLMTFTMSLDAESTKKARDIISKHLLSGLRNPSAVINQPPIVPTSKAHQWVRFGHFWLQRGPLAIPSTNSYVITPSVEAKLSDLARAVMTRKFPILIQGPTSSGKTSAIEFLARSTGHQFVRLNNHEHTDIQEYLGTYTSDPLSGKLVYTEGILVRAVREGHWIVLDELNLAPSDVLEALNRLLDDNRELTIPETQEVIRPHPDFMLFATQNPPGLYGGRKVLSRAFRNRFLEVHFDDVPQTELQTIICQRCAIPPSYAHRIVQVFTELRHRRQAARVFESKQSYATLRDLFRWADRQADGYQQLAENGYMLLGARARREEDAAVVKEVIETVMRVKIDEKALYTISSESTSAYGRLGLPLPYGADPRVVWTGAMQRLFSLVATAAVYKEPVLLVGETGSGKTSVCQALALVLGRTLVAVNCYQTMETADLLGSQRPVRNRAETVQEAISQLHELLEAHELSVDSLQSSSPVTWARSAARKLEELGLDEAAQTALTAIKLKLQQAEAMFQWRDGPLVTAMRDGSVILLDEISLADDSVLERLNSVLEPARTLTLAEKGGSDLESLAIVAAEGFEVVATMNPGGDYGKKELSPALRNRFSEIWVPPVSDRSDLLQILAVSGCSHHLGTCGGLMLDFVDWFRTRVKDDGKSGIGLRDLLVSVLNSNMSIPILTFLQTYRPGAASSPRQRQPLGWTLHRHS
jgi:midasin